MTLLISRLILSVGLIYAFFLVWTQNVNLLLWFKNRIIENLPIIKDDPTQSPTLNPTPEMISQLGSRSLWTSAGGDRESYSILLAWNDSIKDSNLKGIISREINNIKDNYRNSATNLYVKDFQAICKTIQTPGGEPCSEGFEPVKGFIATNVFRRT